MDAARKERRKAIEAERQVILDFHRLFGREVLLFLFLF